MHHTFIGRLPADAYQLVEQISLLGARTHQACSRQTGIRIRMDQNRIAQSRRIRNRSARQSDCAAERKALRPQMQPEDVTRKNEIENLPAAIRQETLPASPARHQKLWGIQKLAFGDQLGSCRQTLRILGEASQ